MLQPISFRNLNNCALEPVSYFMKNFDRAFYMGMHRHSYYEIMYAYKGSFRVEIFWDDTLPPLSAETLSRREKAERKLNIETHIVNQGEFIFIDAQTFHRLRIDSDDVLIYNMELEPKPIGAYNPYHVQNIIPINYPLLIGETGLRYLFENNRGFCILTDSSEVEIYMRGLIYKLTQRQATVDQIFAVQINLIQFLLEIAKCANRMNEGNLSYIRNALNYIKKNFHMQITLDHVANHVELHKVYLSNQFKKHTGRTLFSTITLFRVSKSAQLLRDTNLPISAIVKKVGFKSAAQMNYEFNSHFNESPSSYRKAYLKAIIDHNYADHSSYAIRVDDEDFLLDDETFYMIPKKES